MLNGLRTPLSFALFALALQGCLVEASLDDKGGGTVNAAYRVGKGVTLDAERKRMESPHVKITSESMDESQNVKFALKLDDLTKISTAPFFGEANVTLTDGKEDTKVLTVKVVHKAPSKLPDAALAYFGKDVKISIALPGEIVSSNASATVGNTATWSYEMNEFMNAKETLLTATFKKAAEPKAEKKEG